MKPPRTAGLDRRTSLAHGVLVRGSIKGRILGVRVLTLETTVILAPADVTQPTPVILGRADASGPAPVLLAPADSSEPSPPAIGPPAKRPRTLSARHGVAGPGLAQAIKDLRESAGLLTQARRIAP